MRQMQGFGSVVPEGCGDFWCSPKVLAKIPEQAFGLFKSYWTSRFQFQDFSSMRLIYNPRSIAGHLLYDQNVTQKKMRTSPISAITMMAISFFDFMLNLFHKFILLIHP